jgi:membrane-associated phospholipid phosphatase
LIDLRLPFHSIRVMAQTITWRGLACATLVGCSVSTPAHAQPPEPQSSAVLFDGRDMALFAGATLGTAALTKLDVRLAHMFYDSLYQIRHPGVTSAADRASKVTETALMITGGLVWGVARLNHDAGTADVALHTTEAIASTAMFIQVIRGTLGRARPHVINEKGEKRNGDPYEFQFLHGFTSFNYRSWPSMHAMASFAAASALSTEMRRRNTPHRGLIAPALYVGATAPALARMYLDEHWASDIAMGIFLGVFAGQKAVNYSHDHPDNYADRKFLKPSVRATFTHDARGLTFAITPF